MTSPITHPRPSHVRVCVSALVIRDGRILLLRRGPGAPFKIGTWCAPSGGIEVGDATIVAAAIRELSEETGMRGTSGQIVECVDGLAAPDRPFVSLLVDVMAEGEPSLLDPASDRLGWFNIDDMPVETWDRPVLSRVLRGRQ